MFRTANGKPENHSVSSWRFVAGFVVQIVNRNNYNNDPYVREFGLNVNPKMANFDARILNPPKVKSGCSTTTLIAEPLCKGFLQVNLVFSTNR